jgi:hypothetical protein
MSIKERPKNPRKDRSNQRPKHHCPQARDHNHGAAASRERGETQQRKRRRGGNPRWMLVGNAHGSSLSLQYAVKVITLTLLAGKAAPRTRKSAQPKIRDGFLAKAGAWV